MGKLLELLEKLVRAIFGPGDKQDAEEVKPAPEPPEPPGAEAVTGWQGGPPYRFVDVSRYQGLIDWAQVAAAGYKGAMLKTVSTNRKLSKRADGLYIDPTFESNYRNAKAAGLDVGVYYYTYATSEAMADAELALLRQAVRKFARMFILKKITLDFRETGRTVLTDGKWLSFVVEQVLSNALKYTPAGGRIRIYGDGETLVIADSGIGIRPEDLPRVFEKGFTGYNGREDKKSTGIGLYLCRRVMDRLNHGISIVSRPGQGTLVRLDLSRGRRVVE